MSKKEKALINKKQLYYISEKYNMRIDRPIIRDGFIDVAGDVYISDTSLGKLPLKFGKVKGDFYCHSNKLTTLKGVPKSVGGDFNCANNQLKSLKYAPAEIGGNFSCHENELVSLKGCPKHIHGNFNAFLNRLSSLEGAPEMVYGNCSLFENQLISLEFGPIYVGGSFHITGNQLGSLVGIPAYIGNILSINNLSSLYMGNQRCYVKSVEIEIHKNHHNMDQFLPPILTEKRELLPVLFKYMSYLEIFTAEGDFNSPNFEEIIFDIESGLR